MVGKKYSRSAETGERGVKLIAKIVTDMGHIWRDKPVDHGIDGEIELVDPKTREATGRVVWVQSKAKGFDNRFLRESDCSFEFQCAARDIDYWLAGTAPVVVVCSRPDTDEAWWRPVRADFADPARRRERTLRFDKIADRFDRAASQSIVDLGVPRSSGVYLSPPPRPEVLTTNLLRIDYHGREIYAAKTKLSGHREANDRLVAAERYRASDLVLHGDEVFSLRRFDEAPLDILADGPVRSFPASDWADAKGDSEQRLFAWLLNGTLREQLARELRFHPEKKFLYFKPRADGKPRTSNPKATARARGRTVVKVEMRRDDPTKVYYMRHFALWWRFVRLDGQWLLSLNPTYHFTSDGHRDSLFTGQLTAGIKRQEGHNAVKNLLLFWAAYVRGAGQTLFNPEPDQRLRFGQLATVDVDLGIDDLYWKPPVTPSPKESGAGTLFGEVA
jgi:hypothetical protein